MFLPHPALSKGEGFWLTVKFEEETKSPLLWRGFR
jgi:hypothetical protein